MKACMITRLSKLPANEKLLKVKQLLNFRCLELGSYKIEKETFTSEGKFFPASVIKYFLASFCRLNYDPSLLSIHFFFLLKFKI